MHYSVQNSARERVTGSRALFLFREMYGKLIKTYSNIKTGLKYLENRIGALFYIARILWLAYDDLRKIYE